MGFDTVFTMMYKLKYFAITLFIVVMKCVILGGSSGLRAERIGSTILPNIVLIVADDLGWNDVGYHGSLIRTPNIDRLVAEGVELNRFYTTPVCSPTRAGLLTGRYPIRFGLMRSAIPPSESFGLSPNEVLLTSYLKEANYVHRGILGKWHLGHSDLKYHPLRRGFTYFYGGYHGAIDYFSKLRDGERDWHRDFEPNPDSGYATTLIAGEAVEFISKKSNSAPFFLYVPFHAPHGPLMAPDSYKARYSQLSGPRQTYAAMVSCMDDAIGAILNVLESKGISDNTLIWFLSDNGGNGVGSSNEPLRGLKSSVFEGGIRVPSAVWWPKMLKGGRKVESPIAYIDVLPTLIRILNLVRADGVVLDGIDVFDLLTGRRVWIERDIFSYIANEGDDREEISITEFPWKVVCLGPNIANSSHSEIDRKMLMFRLDSDPSEKINLWGLHRDLETRLVEKMKVFRRLQVAERVKPYKMHRSFVAPDGYPPPDWRMELFPKTLDR